MHDELTKLSCELSCMLKISCGSSSGGCGGGCSEVLVGVLVMQDDGGGSGGRIA